MTQQSTSPTNETIQDRDVVVERIGKAGIITLNRPKALNALNYSMCLAVKEALEDFRDDEAVELVVLKGAGERALCAGGDIAELYHDAKSGGRAGAAFWRDEYQLNHDIATYPKPYVAIMHGIVLGGGIGLSAHGSHRVVTDSTRVGMPETGIGFNPDVGGSYLLSHAAHNLGLHLGLTGIHVGAAEAIAAGLADIYVPESHLELLVEALSEEGIAAWDRFGEPAGEAFGGEIAEIEQAYAAPTVEGILHNLDNSTAAFAADAAKRIRRNSPVAVKVTFEYIRNAKDLSLKQALEEEYIVSNNMHGYPDFVEGVRAQIIDKDRDPSWTPPTLANVDKQLVDELLGALRANDIEPLTIRT